MRTMAVVANNSGSNTKMESKGQCPAKESTLLLLGLVFTHGKNLLQYFLDIFIHLALGNPKKDTHQNRSSVLALSPKGMRWLAGTKPSAFCPDLPKEC